MDIRNKVALVTGGASGIGLACVEELLRNGARGVAIVDYSEAGLAITEELNKAFPANAPRVIFVKTDVVDKSSLEGAFKTTIDTFQNLDIVINNAGIVNEINWERCYDVNLKGATNVILLAMEQYLPKYRSTTDAVIVNTASVSALQIWPVITMYSATKFGILGLTLTFGDDFHFKRTGVRVAAVFPGATDTPLLKNTTKWVKYQMECEELLKSAKLQSADVVAKTFMHAIKEGKSGSLHVIVDGERKEIVYPNFLG